MPALNNNLKFKVNLIQHSLSNEVLIFFCQFFDPLIAGNLVKKKLQVFYLKIRETKSEIKVSKRLKDF
jgi:hypothetical protein